MLIGQTLRVQFVTPSLATGAATDADSLPTAILRKNGSTVGAATVSVSNLGTGLYLAEVLIDAAHSWAVGDAYSLEATWTMAGTAGIKSPLAQGIISTDLNAVLTAIKGGGWSTETLKAIYALIGTRLADADYTAPDNATIMAIAGYVDTEVAAIKAKTDQLTFTAGDVHATLDGETVDLATPAPSAADIATEVDTVLSANHGAGDWTESTGGGLYTFTVTVENDAAVLLVGALVTIQTTGGAIVAWGNTDSNGKVVFSLNPASYNVVLASPAGYDLFSPVGVVISGNQAVTYTLDRSTIAPPADPSLCRLYGWEYLNGSPKSGVKIRARLAAPPRKEENVILSAINAEATTDSNGYWQIDLVRGKKYLLDIDDAAIEKILTMPEEATKNAADYFKD